MGKKRFFLPFPFELYYWEPYCRREKVAFYVSIQADKCERNDKIRSPFCNPWLQLIAVGMAPQYPLILKKSESCTFSASWWKTTSPPWKHGAKKPVTKDHILLNSIDMNLYEMSRTGNISVVGLLVAECISSCPRLVRRAKGLEACGWRAWSFSLRWWKLF